MVQVLAHPFGITPDGSCATVQQGSDQEYSQIITVIVGTRQGEREMALIYGLVDPAFRGLFTEDVQAAVDQFGPPVTIDDITTIVVDSTDQISSVTWSRE